MKTLNNGAAAPERKLRVVQGGRGLETALPATQLTTTPNSGRRFQLACLAGLGLAMGGMASLILAPAHLSARDDGVYELIHQDARARGVATPLAALGFAPLPRLRAPSPAQTEPSVNLPLGATLNRHTVNRRDPRSANGARAGTTASKSRRTICVRMCDGFQFPIGHLERNSDLPGHLALCKASCPDAPVKLFTVAAGSEDIEGATAADGATYGAIPMAFAYQNAIERGCACARPGVSMTRRVAALKDFTLRPGDAIVTASGAIVFEGEGRKLQHTRDDFVDFRQSGELTRAERAEIDARLGVTLRAEQARLFARDLRQQARGEKRVAARAAR